MTIIKVSNTNVLTLLELKRLVDRYVFEQEKMTNAECDTMYQQLGEWSKNLLWLRENGIIPATANETNEEQMVCFLTLKIKEKEEGHFEDLLKLFKDHNIDWRKFLGYAEAYTPQDFQRAKVIYEEYVKTHPEEAR